MPKIKNLAALAAAVEAGRRYARSNPEKTGRYVDQAAAFVDKQTKGKYSGQIDGVVDKVKGAAGLPRTSRTVQGFEANAGYGQHEGYGRTSSGTPSPVTPSTTSSSGTSSSGTTQPSSVPPVGTPPITTPPSSTVDPDRDFPGSNFPGSKDI